MRTACNDCPSIRRARRLLLKYRGKLPVRSESSGGESSRQGWIWGLNCSVHHGPRPSFHSIMLRTCVEGRLLNYSMRKSCRDERPPAPFRAQLFRWVYFYPECHDSSSYIGLPGNLPCLLHKVVFARTRMLQHVAIEIAPLSERASKHCCSWESTTSAVALVWDAFDTQCEHEDVDWLEKAESRERSPKLSIWQRFR